MSTKCKLYVGLFIKPVLCNAFKRIKVSIFFLISGVFIFTDSFAITASTFSEMSFTNNFKQIFECGKSFTDKNKLVIPLFKTLQIISILSYYFFIFYLWVSYIKALSVYFLHFTLRTLCQLVSHFTHPFDKKNQKILHSTQTNSFCQKNSNGTYFDY